jgi:hypothetical protein
MPHYFFHLGRADRTCYNEDGFEFPNRTAARAEAFAVLRDLRRGQPGENGRCWAGFFLYVADAKGTFFSLPIGEPLLAIAGRPRSKSKAHRPLKGRLADAAQSTLETRQRTVYLLQENRKLRDELALELKRGEQTRSTTQRLMASTRSPRLAAAGVSDLRAAMRPPRRSPPQLVVIEGGLGKKSLAPRRGGS